MRSVIYSMMTSLDGFIEGPNQALDWPIIEEELHTFINDQQREFDTYLYGRRMYEVMQYWETADKNPNPSILAYELDFANIWQNMSKIVFSKTLEKVQGNTRLVRGNIAEEVAKLKAQPGKNIAVAGANIAPTVIQLGLIDEYWLYIHPIVLGNGTPMFPPLDNQLNLRLVETRAFCSGVVYLRYQHANGKKLKELAGK